MQRYTQQRNAILNALVGAARPLSPQEVLEAAREGAPTLGIATVYRNLKLLVEDDLVHAVELPGEPPRYEVADLGHHHHFKCVACDRVFDIGECTADLKRLVPAGFTLERHDITLYGRCRECGLAPRARSRG
jgi:Fur family ferric uptake transcriptional regulator